MDVTIVERRMSQGEDLIKDKLVNVELEFGTNPIGFLIDSNLEIVKLIGSGGMGEVYLGKDLLLDRLVAIKVLRNSLSSEHVIRFQREGQILSRLNHPHIASIYQLGVSEQGSPYLVMEYVEGTPLSEIITSEAPLNPYWVMKLVEQLADALRSAHDAGVTHRDLKPANILVTKDSNGFDSVKVIDFGIAKNISSGQDITNPGNILGTPLYMSPEQCMGARLDYRTDIYSVGCIIYEMLVGIPPFQGASVLETVQMHADADPPPLPRKLKNFNYVISKTLAKKPSERYQSIAQVQLDLVAAVLQYGQFKFSPFMFTELSRVRQLPVPSSKPRIVFFTLLAAAFVLVCYAFSLPFPGKLFVLAALNVFLLLAVIQFAKIVYQPLMSLKERERILAKGSPGKASDSDPSRS